MPKAKNGVILLLLPLLVLATSGCVNLGGGGTSVIGNGVAITTFAPSLASIESGEKVMLRLEVQNNGDSVAPTAARILGIYPQDWGLPTETYQLMGNLVPADAEAQTSGGVGTADWQLTAPRLKTGEKRTYEPIARVFYWYQTKVIKPVTFVTSEELRRIVQMGESLESNPAVVSAGPISVDVKTGKFVRTRGDNYRMSHFPVEISLQNTGGGLVYGENYPIGISIEAPPGTSFVSECPKGTQMYTTGGTLPELRAPVYAQKWIYMWNGKDTKFTCELRVDTPPDYKQERDLRLTLYYTYYVDQSTQITVTGTEDIMGGYY